MNTLVARPASAADLPLLAQWHGTAAAPQLPRDDGEWLWVVEDTVLPRVLASVRLRRAIGLVLPRCWYHVGSTVHAAPELGLFHIQRRLLLGNDHTGAAELADLAWADDGVTLAEQAAALRLAVGAALLAIGRQRSAFGVQLIAELPGLRDSAGQSPFWQGLGRHFYSGDPRDGVARHGDAWRSHVAALLPRHPVLVSFLAPAAQAAIAQVDPPARLLRELFEAAGLRYGHHVRIDDGGPVLEADIDTLPALAGARAWDVAAQRDGNAGSATWLVMSGSGRALRCAAQPDAGALRLPAAALEALVLQRGDSVWALPA